MVFDPGLITLVVAKQWPNTDSHKHYMASVSHVRYPHIQGVLGDREASRTTAPLRWHDNMKTMNDMTYWFIID